MTPRRSCNALRIAALSGLLTALGMGAVAARDGAAGASPAENAFTTAGKLKFPAHYREWIFLSSGMDMSYTDESNKDAESAFDNVFVDPAAYREFEHSGTWPDATLLVLESRGASTHGSINQHGKFQTAERMGVEVHIKDTKRFAGGWGFFAFDGTQPAAQIPTTETCYSCHQQHAAVDTTFVQFYPTLLGIATAKRTLSRGYRP